MNVVVVGGGLAGLVAAHDLTQAGLHTTVLERDVRLGGQVWSTCSNGFLIEHGAEGYATGQAAGYDLCRDLRLLDRLVSQAKTQSFELRDGDLVPAPPGRAAELAGIQADRADVGRGITTLAGGMGELIDALRAALSGSPVRPATEVQGVEPQPRGWKIATATGETLRADALILAIPAGEASRLLTPLARDAADTLAAFRVVSSVTVSLAFERSAVRHPLDGAGFVSAAGPVASGFRACTFASSQFPGRTLPGHVLLRAFFRPGPRHPLDAAEARWVDLALGSLKPVLGIGADPAGAWVARWPNALPRYARDHEAHVSAVTRSVSREGAPLALAGAAYRSAGVAGAIASGRAAAQNILLASKA